MKKTFILFFAFVFLVETLGITMSIAYCPMQKNYSFALSGNASCCCKKKDHSKCCTSKKIVFQKISSSYVSTGSQLAPVSFDFINYSPSSAAHFSLLVSRQNSNLNRDHSPPGRSVALNILHGSLLI
ncbi:MAG: hypothetical protein HY064_06130 [Bacteroidetes bacterium]|nr:hypothetical protein [Bacteroidota bacterium]